MCDEFVPLPERIIKPLLAMARALNAQIDWGCAYAQACQNKLRVCRCPLYHKANIVIK